MRVLSFCSSLPQSKIEDFCQLPRQEEPRNLWITVVLITDSKNRRDGKNNLPSVINLVLPWSSI